MSVQSSQLLANGTPGVVLKACIILILLPDFKNVFKYPPHISTFHHLKSKQRDRGPVITVTSLWARLRLKSRCLDCLLNRLCRRWSKKASKLLVTGLCDDNPPVTGGFPSQRDSNAVKFPFHNVIMVWLFWSNHVIKTFGILHISESDWPFDCLRSESYFNIYFFT